MPDPAVPVLEARALGRDYRDGARTLTVLDGLDFAVSPGETVAVVGHSGCGKTTLLQCLGLLDRPTRGTVRVRGIDAAGLSERKRTALRASKIGFVFQHYPLLEDFTALENVTLARGAASGGLGRAVRTEAAGWLDRVGLADRAHHRPSKLSGGERQRCAIARALMNRPSVLLCDEPTGNLDEDTGAMVMALFSSLTKAENLAVLLVTHERALARGADRVLRLERGRLAPADGYGTAES